MQARKALTAMLLWMVDAPLKPGQNLIIKLGTVESNARVAALRHAVDIHSFQNQPAETLPMNAIGVVDLTVDKAIAATIYGRDRELGSFILIDPMTNQTVALGIIEPDAPKQANDNVRGQTLRKLFGEPGSAKRWTLLTTMGRKATEAVVLVLVVAILAQNAWLALAVSAADLLLRPIADRVAAWGWNHLFTAHHHSHASGHAD